MATAAYMVELDGHSGRNLQGGKNGMIVRANSTTEAKAMAKAVLGADFGSDALWAGATVTAIADPTDWFTPNVWGFRIQVTDPHGTVDVLRGGEVVTLTEQTVDVTDVTVYSSSGDNTIDEVAALLVTALNAAGPMANAAYNSTTQVLSIAIGGSDALGDHYVTLTSWPVIADTAERNDLLIGGFFGALTHNGMSSADLKVTLGADALVPPMIYRAYKKVD
jgi:hypothetical protein